MNEKINEHLVKKLQGHVTNTKNDDVFGRQRKKQDGQRHQYIRGRKQVRL